MDKICKKELSTWWDNQTQKVRHEVLRKARFRSGDIKTHSLVKQSINHLEAAGWEIQRILVSRLELGYYN